MEAKLTLTQAQQTYCCRICGEPIPYQGLVGCQNEFGEMVNPIKVTLNFGDEFAHTDCLPKEETGG